MNTENRKPAADDPANDPANVPEDDATAQTGDPGNIDPENIGPENGASETGTMAQSASGWTARADEAEAAEAETDLSEESEVATIARLEAEKSDLTDRLLRVVAEMDNLRKRTEREVADARKFSLAGFAGDMLSVSEISSGLWVRYRLKPAIVATKLLMRFLPALT